MDDGVKRTTRSHIVLKSDASKLTLTLLVAIESALVHVVVHNRHPSIAVFEHLRMINCVIASMW